MDKEVVQEVFPLEDDSDHHLIIIEKIKQLEEGAMLGVFPAAHNESSMFLEDQHWQKM